MEGKTGKDLELQLLTFYQDFIQEQIKLNPDSLKKSSVKKLRKGYLMKIRQSGISDVSFISPASRCGYIFQYSPCFASATAFHFSAMLNKDSLLDKIIHQDTFTICCLGGGPAAEIVAISLILDAAMKTHPFQRYKPLTINAVIIDNEPSWSETAQNLIQSLQKFIDISTMRLTFRFLQCDLMKPLTEDVKDALGACDVITMVKLLSVTLGAGDENIGTYLIQEIIHCIRDGGIVFVLDSSGFKHFNVFDSINGFESMEQIYGTLKGSYRLSPASRKYLRSFSKSHNMPLGVIFSCNKIGAWLKKQSKV